MSANNNPLKPSAFTSNSPASQPSSPIDSILEQWGALTDAQTQLLQQAIHVQMFKKGQAIHRAHAHPDSIKFLLQGKVKISKQGISGRNQIIRVVKAEQFFGYRAHFAQEDHTSSAIALEPSCVAFIPTDTVDTLVQENPAVGRFFIHLLSKQLGASDKRIVSLTQKHIRGRLAEALLYLKDTYGTEQDGCTLGIQLSREDLACIANMTTSNAIRTLSSFANEKLIAIERKKIKIIDDDQLHKISAIG